MDPTETTLAGVAFDALDLFKQISTGQVGAATTLEPAEIEQQKQRYDLWATNIGVHQQGHASLDYRLRDAPNIQAYCQTVLTNLVEALEILKEELSSSLTDVTSTQNDAPTGLPLYPVDNESESSFSEDGYDEETMARVAFLNVADCIDRLYRLSMKVRNPTTRTGSSKGYSYTQIDPDTGLDLFDCFQNRKIDHNHIWNVLFDCKIEKPSQDNSLTRLVARLAYANNLRRRQFAYWRQHKLNLTRRTARFHAEAQQQLHGTGHAFHHAPSLSQRSKPTTATHLDVTRINMIDDDDKSVVSAISMSVPDVRDSSEATIVFPEPPDRYTGKQTLKEFECPYCFTVCSTRLLGHRHWKAHVIKDLRPYVCTFDGCKNASQLYDSFSDWANHEILEHQPNATSGDSMTTLRPCPLCNKRVADAVALERHLAIHLIRIAIFAMPRSTGVETHQDDQSGASNVNAVNDDDDDNSENSQNLSSVLLDFRSRSGSSGRSEEDLEDVAECLTPPEQEHEEIPALRNVLPYQGGREPEKEENELQPSDRPPTSTEDHVTRPSDKDKNKELRAEYSEALSEYSAYEQDLSKLTPAKLSDFFNLAIALDKAGEAEKAEEMFQRVIAGSEKVLGEEHVLTLDAIFNLANLYRVQAKQVESEEMYKRALVGYEKILGPEHISTIDTVNNIGLLYAHHGRHMEAEQMYVRALAGYEKAVGLDHTATLNTVRNLGILLAGQNDRLAEAEQMFTRALAGYEIVVGSEHVFTLNALHHLGHLYANQGRLDEAEALYLRAIAGYEKSPGYDEVAHFDTVYNLAKLYSDQADKAMKAEEMYLRALAGYEEVLGRGHVSTLDTVYNLGKLYYTQEGRLEEVEQLYVRALDGYEKALGPDHTWTLHTLINLGNVYIDRNKLTDAENMLTRAYAGYEKVYGPENTATVDAIYNLGRLYYSQSRPLEAEKMYTKALEGYRKLLGDDHMSTLDTVYNLAQLHFREGRKAIAEEMYLSARAGYSKALGPESKWALNVTDDLGELYEDQDMLSEARTMYASALTGYEKLLGPMHATTRRVSRKLRSLRLTEFDQSSTLDISSQTTTE